MRGHSFQFKCFRNRCCWCEWRWFYGSCCCYVWWVSWTVKVTLNTASHSFGNYGWEKYIAIKSVLLHVNFVFSSVSLCETWRLRCTGTCRENSLDRKVRTIRTSVPLLGLDEKTGLRNCTMNKSEGKKDTQKPFSWNGDVPLTNASWKNKRLYFLNWLMSIACEIIT